MEDAETNQSEENTDIFFTLLNTLYAFNEDSWEATTVRCLRYLQGARWEFILRSCEDEWTHNWLSTHKELLDGILLGPPFELEYAQINLDQMVEFGTPDGIPFRCVPSI